MNPSPNKCLAIVPVDHQQAQPMARIEARHHTEQIQYHTAMAREHIRAVYDREGWRSLGYASFRAWVEAELPFGYQWAMKLRQAAIQADILRDANIEVSKMDSKKLNMLRQVPSRDDKLRVMTLAQELAASVGESHPTDAHYRSAMRTVKTEAEVKQSPYAIVRQMMASGEITAPIAKEMSALLDAVPVRQRGMVLEIIAVKGLGEPKLIPRIAAVVARPESKLLPSLKMGYINQVPLSRANLTDWEQAAEEARREHIAEKNEEQNVRQLVEARVCTVYRTSPGADVAATAARTARALNRELRPEDLLALINALGAMRFDELAETQQVKVS